jgi:hypothetical protein
MNPKGLAVLHQYVNVLVGLDVDMENGLCQDAIGPNGKSDFNSYADALWWGVVSTSAGWGGRC